MRFKVNPWDQQRGESTQAFAAFRAYLELGSDRNFLRAYRTASGRKDANQVPGTWNTWIKRHEWHERARAWDTSIAQAVDVGILKHAQSRGERMITSLDQVLDEAMAGAIELVREGRRLVTLPEPEPEAAEQGDGDKAAPAVDANDKRWAAVMIEKGLAIASAAYDRAMGQIRDAEKTQAAGGESSVAMDRAAREAEAWRADQRAKIIAIPSEPPKPPDPGADGAVAEGA